MEGRRLAVDITADLAPRPAAWYSDKWCPDLDPEDAHERIRNWCSRGKIPGAFHGPDGKWWVQPLLLLNWEPAVEETEETTTSEGDGGSRDGGPARPDDAPRQKDDQRAHGLRRLENGQGQGAV